MEELSLISCEQKVTDEKIENLPPVKNRTIGNKYIDEKGNIVIWTGIRLHCKHNKRKSRCKDCKGNSICEHNVDKYNCKKCKGPSICVHGIQKSYCKKCKGGSICKHDKVRTSCKDCKGGSICDHNKRKSLCSICSVNRKNFCKLCDSIFVRGCSYDPLCFRCYCLSNPDKSIPRRFKSKERYIYDILKDDYENEFIYDKSVGGCSKYRPDFLFDCLTHSVIVEIDEEQHRNTQCEEKRMMTLFEDLGNRPLILIRFNPDRYYENDEKYQSIFTFDEKNNIIANKEELEKRIKILLETINYHRENIPEKEVTEIKLFYDALII